MAFNWAALNISKAFHTSAVQNKIIKLCRLRVVDNCEIGKKAMKMGKPPRVIHIYNKEGVGYIGEQFIKINITLHSCLFKRVFIF